MISCISSPALTEEEALDAKFAGGAKHKRRGSVTDMSPALADSNDKAMEFVTPGGKYVLIKRWHHPEGPRTFHVRCPTNPIVAKVPGTKGKRCLLFNVGGSLVIHNFTRDSVSTDNTPSQPIRIVTFPNTTVTSLAHRDVGDDAANATERDLIIGCGNGEVFVVSLRGLIMMGDGKDSTLPSGSLRFNSDGAGGTGNSYGVVREIVSASAAGDSGYSKNAMRCTSAHWFPEDLKDSSMGNYSGTFLTTHADGNTYVYHDRLGDSIDPCFCEVKGVNDIDAVSVTLATSEKNSQLANPVARYRVGDTSVTSSSIAPNGESVVLAGTDGVVRVLDVRVLHAPKLIDGFKSHFGGVDCVQWGSGPGSGNGGGKKQSGRFTDRSDIHQNTTHTQPSTPRFILAGGEADIVEVWDRAFRCVVARGEGHSSWITAVCETLAGGGSGGNSDASEDTTEDDSHFMVDASDDTKHAKSSIDHRYDDLLVPDDAALSLRFTSAGQDCRVCTWEVPVDEAPEWWAEDAEDLTQRNDHASVSSNTAIPGSTNENNVNTEGDGCDRVLMPTPVAFGRLGSDAAAHANASNDASNDSSKTRPDVNPETSNPAQLMFPTLRDEGTVGGVRAAGVSSMEAVSSKSCMGKHHENHPRPIALAASRSATPIVPPTANHKLHGEPITGLVFVEEGVITSCGAGLVKLWRRAE